LRTDEQKRGKSGRKKIASLKKTIGFAIEEEEGRGPGKGG